MINTKDSKLLLEFELHCKSIQQATAAISDESFKDKDARIRKAQKDYVYFVEYYFPHYAKSECGWFHKRAAKEIKENPTAQFLMEWARGHAKSTHFDIMIPLWLKMQEVRTINTMVLISKNEAAANRLLADVQAELQHNQRYINDFGVQFNYGNWEDGEFTTRDGVFFIALGRGQTPRGLRNGANRPDYIVWDDIDDDEMCRNPKRVREVCDWLQEAVFGTMDMGQGRFIGVGNRIGKVSVIAYFATKKGIIHIKVNALNKHGEPNWKEKYTKEQIQAIRNFMGLRAFEKEYMNNPITEGTIFKNAWIRFGKMYKLREYEMLVAYGDPSFKDHGDFKAIRFWGKKGKELHLINCYVRQSTVSSFVKWWYDFHESIPADVIVYHYMEANFMQDIILDEFEEEGLRRGYQLPIRPDTRKKPDKLQRVESISPFWERGFVTYNEKLKDNPDMQAGIEQTLAIEKGSKTNDDAPDADEGAIWILQKNMRNDSDLQNGVTLGMREVSDNSY